MDITTLDDLAVSVPDIFEELDGRSDRAAAVLGAAFLDAQLAMLLRSRLRGGASTERRLLDRDRPLSSFSARIEAAYGFGLISKRERDDLHLIRRIRNRFAHRVTAFDFGTAGLEDRVQTLASPDLTEGLFEGEDRHESEHRRRFSGAVKTLSLTLIIRIGNVREAEPPEDFSERLGDATRRLVRNQKQRE